MLTVSREVRIEWGDCDPAGIVFYPRYFEMINQSVEEWFDRGLGHPFPALHMRERRGVPVVTIDIRFTAPSELGDRLAFAIGVERVGGSSFTFGITARCEGELRLRARMVLAFMDLDTRQPARLPDGLRAAMEDCRADLFSE